MQKVKKIPMSAVSEDGFTIPRQARSISRDEVLTEFQVMAAKQDVYSDMKFMGVQSPFSSFYGGLDPRRRREVADAGMVREDRNAISNLSETPVHKEYTPNPYVTTPYLSGIVKSFKKARRG